MIWEKVFQIFMSYQKFNIFYQVKTKIDYKNLFQNCWLIFFYICQVCTRLHLRMAILCKNIRYQYGLQTFESETLIAPKQYMLDSLDNLSKEPRKNVTTAVTVLHQTNVFFCKQNFANYCNQRRDRKLWEEYNIFNLPLAKLIDC